MLGWNRRFVAVSWFFLFAAVMPLHARQRRSSSASQAWHAMGDAPCAWSVPFTNADRSLDVDATIAALKANHFTCHAMPIGSGPPNDWPNFRKLVVAANAAGIDIWAVLIPPSEGASSMPYGADYVRWAKRLANLSLRYPRLRGMNIDDIDRGISPKTFTHDYLCSIDRAKQRVNPQFQFITTVYDLDSGWADRLSGCVDGVWLWWVNLEKETGFISFLENAKLAVRGRFPIYGGVYAHSTSWHREGNPTPVVFTRTLTDACEHSNGAVIWLLELQPSNPLLPIAESFAPGGSSPLAGRCGLIDPSQPR